jgi:Ribosomal protein S21e
MRKREVRKCSFTKRPISPQDRSSVVFTLGSIDENGRYTGESCIVNVCGSIRKDGSIDRIFYHEALENRLGMRE